MRELLGIPFDGRGVFSNSMTIYFEADLWPQLGGKPISIIYINNPVFGGFFRVRERLPVRLYGGEYGRRSEGQIRWLRERRRPTSAKSA